MKQLLLISLLLNCAACSTSPDLEDQNMKSLTEVLACWPRTLAELAECGMRDDSRITSTGGLLTLSVDFSDGVINYLEIAPSAEKNIKSESLDQALDAAAGEVAEVDFSHDNRASGEQVGLITIQMRRRGGRQLATHIDEKGNLVAIYLVNAADP